ncbi:hypothetical protein TNCV_1234091 [Trichonephila clavipes]|nr:hypothetical protein TNCV_1234091 [Trichonephila clavipes]
MLPFCPNDFDDNNITKIAARAEESRQLARVHTLSSRQRSSTLRFKHKWYPTLPEISYGFILHRVGKSVGLNFLRSRVLEESRSFFRVHTGYFSNIPKCIKAEFIASWACSQSSVVSSSQR